MAKMKSFSEYLNPTPEVIVEDVMKPSLGKASSTTEQSNFMESFSKNYEAFTQNVEKAEQFIEKFNELAESVKPNENLIERGEVESILATHLLIINQNIQEIKKDLLGINESDLSKITDVISSIDARTETLIEFVQAELPKNKNKLYELSLNLDKKVALLSAEISDVEDTTAATFESVSRKLAEAEAATEEQFKLSDEVKVKILAKVNELYEDVHNTNVSISTLSENYDAVLLPAIERINAFEENLTSVDSVVQEYYSSLDKTKEELKQVINEVNTIFINEKYVELDRKVQRIEEIFESVTSAKPLNEEATILTPEELKSKTAEEVEKYLSGKSFQQPNPDAVSTSPEFKNIANKLKFLEQAIGRIAATGPGGGEVNLRYLDDIDRASIQDGRFLKYDAATKKFVFSAIDLSALNYQGVWNALANSPTLVTGTGTKGYYYIVGSAGTTNLNDISDWQIGDWVVFSGTAWQKIDNTDSVTSVNGQTGAVVLGSMSNQNANAVAITGGSITVKDNVFTLQDDADPTKQAQFQLSGLLTGTTYVYTLPTSNGGASTLVDLNSNQTINASKTFSGAANIFGSSSNTSAVSVATGATVSGATKTVNVGTGGLSGSTTNITVGSANGSTTTMLGSTTIGGVAGNQSLQVNNVAGAVDYLQVTGNSGGFPSLSAQGASTNVSIVYGTKGTGGHNFTTNGTSVNQFVVTHTASAVNYAQVSGAVTGSPVIITAQGSDTNVNLAYAPKGTGRHTFYSNSGTQFVVGNTASAVNYAQTDGAATGAAPTISAQGSDANVGLVLQGKGTGVVALGGTTTASSGFRVNPVASSVNYVQAQGGITGNPATVSSQGTDSSVILWLQAQGNARTFFVNSGAFQASINPVVSAVNYLLLAGGTTGNGAELSSVGSDTNIDLLLRSKGTGVVALGGSTAANSSLTVSPTASAVNYVEIKGNVTGQPVYISAQGSDANIPLIIQSKGTQPFYFVGNNAIQFATLSTASAVNYAFARGSAAGSGATIGVQGSDTNIDLLLSTKGTGVVALGGSTVANSAAQFVPTTAGVNFLQFTGGAAGISPSFISSGTDASVGFNISTKGNANIAFFTNNFGNFSFIAKNVASAVNYIQTQGAATTGAPELSAQGSDANINLKLTPKGTGVVTVTSDAVINGMTVGIGGGSLAQNAAFGGVTLPFNTTGNFNVAVGYQSMFWNKTGSSNVGLGFATLFLNTTANQNLAMGVSALTVLTTSVATLGAITAGSGYTNGTYTAVAMTPVSGATFVTYPTVTVVVSGGVVSSVTLVTSGQGASSAAATVLTVAAALIGGTGSGFSIAVGSFVAGGNNTAIGYQAGSTLATGSNNTLIGYQAAASSTTVSNEVTLGNSSVTAFRIPGLSITGAASALTIGSQFAVTNTASAVNYAQVTGAATTGAPTISAQGSDTNIGLNLSAKGSGSINAITNGGVVNLSNGSGLTGVVRTNGGGGYTSAFTATVSAPTTQGGVTATVIAYAAATIFPIASGGTGYSVNDVLTVVGGTGIGAQSFTVTSVNLGVITGVSILSYGIYTVLPPSTPATTTVVPAGGTGATFNLSSWSMSAINVVTAGSGYVETPTITVNGTGGSGAAAYALIGSSTTLKTIGSNLILSTASGPQVYIADNGGITTDYVYLGGSYFGRPGVGAKTITGSGNASLMMFAQGTGGTIQFATNNSAQKQVEILHTASAVNFLTMTGAATTGAPTISAGGSDTNIGLLFNMKGWSSIAFGSTTGGKFFQVGQAQATTANLVQILGNSANNPPVIQATGSDTDISLLLQAKNAGVIALSGTTVANSSLLVQPIASSVNYVQIKGAVTNGSPTILALGGDADVSLSILAKNNASVNISNGNGIAARFYGGSNYLNLAGAGSGGAGPEISVIGVDTNIDLKLTPKGTGVLNITATATPAAAVASTHKIPVKINGVTYYILVSNV